MNHGRQRTLGRPARVHGRGLFHGNDVTLTLLPAPEYHGIVFQRVDLASRVLIPARVEYVVAAPRRTVLSRLGAEVETVEHVLAALAGMQVDNCIVQVTASECPNGDGSAQAFVEAIDSAGIVPQSALVTRLDVAESCSVCDESTGACWTARPTADDTLHIDYELLSPFPGCDRQALSLAITPSTFANELAKARTFVRESEVQSLRAVGLGRRTTPSDLIVFDTNGMPIQNALRYSDECVRHKILDCIGDFALGGARLSGNFSGQKTGHRHNHELIRQIRDSQLGQRRRTA
ncbi:MAG: UDP-3-O-[3-hydroxymyristoyl] N-acetylglucosamine deacetylase [Planctomycetaceae bacterium]|nr:UDP-3-O-[3-hydroxymyristoyl] N-acetylglucosamine deacetylase [Planctomycetaceae bacterium]